MFVKWHKTVISDDFQNNLWTVLSSVVFSVYTFLVVLIATRWVGLAEAGIVSFAFAVAIPFLGFVTFAVRGFQGSDSNAEFSFHSYLGLRVCTAFAATAVMAVFLVMSGFDETRTLFVIFTYFIFLTGGFADVFLGDLQQKGKMRIAGRIHVCSYVLGFLAFVIVFFVSQSLIVALATSGVAILISFVVWIWVYQNHFGKIRIKFDIAAIKTLTKKVLPLFIGGLILGYLVNMQKYYLGFLVSDEAVGIITILAMPGTALQMLCTPFFSGAELTKTAGVFASGRINDFSRRINRQLLVALALAVVFLICSYTFGLPLLSVVYGVDLSQYMQEFMVISIGGAFFALMAVFQATMVVMRLQNAWLYSILAISVVTAPLMWLVVSRYGLSGAVFSNLIILAPWTLILLVICRVKLKREATSAIDHRG